LAGSTTINSPAKLQSALLGGVVIGVLSALPVINLANCCCGWVLFGGGLAAYLMQQNHPDPVTTGDGAIVGLLAGIFGAIIGALVAIPISLMMGPFQAELLRDVISNPDLPAEWRRIFEQAGAGPAFGLGFVLIFFASVFVSAIFGTLGGLFGSLIFRKKQAPVIPPPIPPVPPTVF
jgi:hypothetical protein